MSISDTVQASNTPATENSPAENTSNQYWEQFSFLPADLEYLVNHLVETECPLTLPELARELILYRHQQSVNLIEDLLSQGRIYRPRETYHTDERVIFPHLRNALGTITGVRPGRNPEYEPFQVICVRMDEGSTREFAAGLSIEHPLNTASYLTDGALTAEELVVRYGAKIEAILQATLETQIQFISVADKWFIRDLIVDIPAGQLNIAEALLDMANGGPISTPDLLEELDLPAEVSQPLQLFSLEHALMHDARFDEVGPAGKAMWYLRSKEPREVLETPERLRYMPVPYNWALLDATMRNLEKQAADEWGNNEPEEGALPAVTTITLSYPHWRSGTLPLASHIARLFPTARITDRIRFSFMDGETHEEFPGWVVRSNRYVYGLAKWYEKTQVNVGTYLDLRLGETPGTIIIQARRLRSRRREWLRSASVEDGQLYLEVSRIPLFCEFDELMAVAVADPQSLDTLAVQLRRTPLEDLLEQAFSSLAGLSLQRAVHALTLYSVLNLVRRIPPAPVLAILANSPKYVSLGDNYWAYRGVDA